MPVPPAFRTAGLLVVGLVIGGIGAVLFRESLPGAEGSAEERANRLEFELKQALNRIAALEAASGTQGERGGVLQRMTGPHDRRRTLRDGARDIAEDIRAGRPVTPEDIFRASQPLMRDLAPLFDRMRLREQQKVIDSLTGEIARKYDLTPEQQGSLNQWFKGKAAEEAKKWSDLVGTEGTRLQDLMKASREIRPDAGLDEFMPSVLSGEKLTKFQTQRLEERADRVEREADARVQRLDSIVGLDQAQRDQIFGISARGSKEYDPRMVLDGVAGDATGGSGNVNERVLSVLRPDQRAAYEVERQRRREEAAKDLEAIGLSLPADWDMFGDDFR
jgi:hypothetical protein